MGQGNKLLYVLVALKVIGGFLVSNGFFLRSISQSWPSNTHFDCSSMLTIYLLLQNDFLKLFFLIDT